MREWYRVLDMEDPTAPVEIDIYGDIGSSFWDDDAVSASQLLDAIRDAGDREIDVHINSCGGDVFDAFAMMTALRRHKRKVTCHIDGIAASAASYVACAADEVVMSSVAWMMIHDASAYVCGNAGEIREEADRLDHIDEQISAIYSKRGDPDTDFRALMADETWLDAEGALAVGLADGVEEAVATAAHVDTRCITDLGRVPGPVLAMVAADDGARNVPDDGTGAGDGESTIGAETGAGVQEDPAADAGQEPDIVVIDGHLYTRGQEI